MDQDDAAGPTTAADSDEDENQHAPSESTSAVLPAIPHVAAADDAAVGVLFPEGAADGYELESDEDEPFQQGNADHGASSVEFYTSDEEEELLSDPDDDPDAVHVPPLSGEAGRPSVTPRGAASKKHQALYPAARVQTASAHSVLMAVYALTKCKLDYNMQTEGWQMMLKIFSELLPADNKLPTSFVVCKNILGVRDLQDFWWDACVCGGWSWDPKGTPGTREDKCPCTGCNRMRYKPDDGSGKLIPCTVRRNVFPVVVITY